ncbi:MAG: TSUP family transporter [SAR324 cluster bacterium]|nr:TSUP family transporter [SAR324 cluster bacterium]
MKVSNPFCENQWKIKTLFLLVSGLALFAWAFHVLSMHGEYRIYDVGNFKLTPKEGALHTAAAPAVPATGPENAVVAVMGFNELSNQFENLGSGVIVSDDGYVVTALHLLHNIHLINIGGIKAQVIKLIPKENLALLKIVSNDTFPFISLDGAVLQNGDPVTAHGVMQGPIARTGVITALGASLTVNDSTHQNLIRTNAIGSWAHSGGALMNPRGRMVGLNLAITEPVVDSIVGYAIPSVVIFNNFREIVDFGAMAAASRTLTTVKGDLIEKAKGFADGIKTVIESDSWVKILVYTDEAISDASDGVREISDSDIVSELTLYTQEQKNEWWKKSREFSESLANVNALTMIQQVEPHLSSVVALDFTIFGHTIDAILALSLLGFVSGVTAGMFTMGGGVIKISGLMIFFGYGLTIIRPIAYLTNIFVYGGSALRFRKDNMISWGHVTPLIPFALAGFLVGYFTGNYLDNTTVRFMLGVYANWIGIKMVLEIQEYRSKKKKKRAPKSEEKKEGRFSHGWLGFPMGIASGILGISGGVIEVPLQHFFAKVPLRQAIANSSVLVFCTSSLGALVAMIHGTGIGAFDFMTPVVLAALIMPSSYLGGMVGAFLTKVVSIVILKGACAALLFLIAIRMLFYAL